MSKTKLLLITILMCCLAISNGFAATIAPFLQSRLDVLSENETVHAIAYIREQADLLKLDTELKANNATLAERNRRVVLELQKTATRTQPEIIDYLDNLLNQGIIVKYEMFWIANMFSIEANTQGILAAASREDIAELFYNYEIENIEPVKKGNEGNLIASREIGLDRINAPAVWALGWTGAGRVVMNIDTGVDGNHPALASRFRGDVDGDGDVDESWYDPYDTHWIFPQDGGSHGTHTMGTICGRSAGGDTIGVAIEAQWIAAAAIDRGGGIPRTVADAILAFQWAVDPDGNPNTQDNPDAIGNSWGVTTSHGYPPCDQTFWTVIDNVELAGSVVVFSAGNEGTSGLRRPADRGTTPYNCFAVGAVDGANPSLPIASFSSRGPSNCGPNGETVIKPEVVAPGVSVRSSIPGGGYTTMSGTSMASPHVTGSVAILRQVNPNLDVETIKDILMQTATDLGSAGEDNDYGHGNINLLDAVILASTGFGFVEGNITDAGNSNPLPATIELVGESRSMQANSSGYYFMSAPADSLARTIRASYFGYLPQEQLITISQDDTVFQDFQLSPAPSAALQGTVTSLSGDSIGNAEITILNTPILPETTDAQGFYQFPAVPSGSSYLVQAKAIGYSQGSDSIFIQYGQTNELDFSLQPAESFEASNGGFNGSGEWEWGTATQGPSNAWSGIRLWGTDLDNDYNNGVDDPLYSIDYVISSPIARLEFYQWYAIESGWDGGNVSISTNGGSSWTLLTPVGNYPDNSVTGLDNEPGYTGSSDWALAVFDISSYYGETVRFKWRFGSDVSVTDAGWYIDDVVVIGSTPPEPPDISYSPQFFSVNTAPGNIETRDLDIGNIGNGPLVFSLGTTTNNLLLDNGTKIPVTISFGERKPIKYYKEEISKQDLEMEPIYAPVITGQGGPDIFGHEWIDSDEPSGPPLTWVDISGSGTSVNLNDDDYSSPINIGFSFPFYDNNYTQLYICSNGMLTFGAGSTDYSNDPIPGANTPDNFISAWWDDLNPAVGGTIRYYQDSANNRFIVSYDGIPNWSYGGNLNFQAILYPDGDIELNYATMDPGTDQLNLSTIGIENSNASDGLGIVYNADYMHSNLSIRIKSGSWLSATPNSGIIPPNDSTSATITFDATDLPEGNYTGNIDLDSNDPSTPQIDIAVTLNVGTGGTAEILQTPSSITETLESGGSKVDTIEVKNTGTAILTVAFSEAASWLSIPTGPFDIVPGDSLLIEATINASGLLAGAYIDSIITATNDPVNPTIDLPVTLNVLAADIDVASDSISETLTEGNQIVVDLTIRNQGSAILDLHLEAIENTILGKLGDDQWPLNGAKNNQPSILSNSDKDASPVLLNVWLFINPSADAIPPGDSLTAQVALNAVTLTPDTYTGQINLASNDPADPLVVVPVTLEIMEAGGACVYLPGDVNGSDSYNGLDITYSVAYFKGGASPLFECECTPGNTWYVSGDVNNSCSFNGLDVTYGVSYFKGGAAPVPCQDCPPGVLIAIENRTKEKPAQLEKR